MSPLAQKIYEANRQRYESAKNPLRSHGPDHHLRVYKLAVELADGLGATYDDDILAAAALLHDLSSSYYPDESGDRYHDFDTKYVPEILTEVDFPKEKTDAVVYAIAHHGSDAKFKDESEPIEVTLLRDADKLDAFGPIGVARIVMVRSLQGDELQDIVDDFYTKGHLERKWQSITTDAARQMGRTDYEYSREFFAQLAQSLRAG